MTVVTCRMNLRSVPVETSFNWRIPAKSVMGLSTVWMVAMKILQNARAILIDIVVESKILKLRI